MFAIALWVLAILIQVVAINEVDEFNFFLELFSALVGITCYSAVVIGFGQRARLTQTITALLGCGALLALIFTVALVLLQALGSQILLSLMVWSVVLWSVSIKGHIIATTINQHWYAGLAIAVSVFVLQHVVHTFVTAA